MSRKARFLCSPLVFEGVLVSCFQIALLRGFFEQGSLDNLFPISVIKDFEFALQRFF